MARENKTERPGNKDTGPKEFRRRRIELFSALSLLCFGVINYLDILGKKEVLEIREPATPIPSSLEKVPRREFEQFKESITKEVEELGKDVREIRVVMLNGKAAR